MKIKAFVLLYAGLLLAAISLVQVQNTLPKVDVLTEEVTGATKQRVVETYGKLPLSFEANQGQTDSQVKFLSRGSGYTLFLTPTEAVLSLPSRDRKGAEPSPSLPGPSPPEPSTVLRMKLIGANPSPRVSGLEELPGRSNYFIGNDPAKWRTDVPTYAKVQYKDIYPGVDLVYYGNQRQLEYDLIVAPGADPEAIQLAFEGEDKLVIDAQGDLVLDTPGGEVRQHKPLVYQEVDGGRREIAGTYVLNGGRQVSFQVAAYDAGKPLIIDPVLSYSTYLGGGSTDRGYAIAVDSSGNAYVTGQTDSTNFPTASPIQPANDGNSDVFVTKLNASGNALVYSTYLGGGSFECGFGIAVDGSGNAYVAGDTSSSDFPTASPMQPAQASGDEAFVTKLNAAGDTLVYSTYLGGDGNDDVLGIAVDASGNAYVTGSTSSTDFPTASPLQPAFGGNSDVFVAKLNAAGAALVYSTYLGGSEFDIGLGIAVDASGNAYVTGVTRSTNFPTASPIQPANAGGSQDAFVTKLNVSGNALVYSTYLGGSGSEMNFGGGIAVDASGNAYATGDTQSSNFPTASPIQPKTMFEDIFVTKLNASGNAFVYSTYLGGSGGDLRGAIAVDGSGNAYVTGSTDSTNFPTTPGAFQAVKGGGRFDEDAFIAKITDQSVGPPTPTLPANSVVNGASFRAATDPNGAVAPGAIVAIFGTDLASDTLLAGQVPLPTTLGETSVAFDNIPASLFFVSGTQINAQVPFELMAGAGSVTVQVKRGSETSTAQPIGIAAVSPGVFTLNQQGTGDGAILRADDFQPVSESAPAQPGEFLAIFCTGLGPVQPEVPSGDVAPTAEPLARTVSLPMVNIAGIAADVTFSGLAPGFVGLYQVNVQVPGGVPAGTQDVEIIINGVSSKIVTVPVSP